MIIFVLILAFFLIFSVFKPGTKVHNPEVQTTTLTETTQGSNVQPSDNQTPNEAVTTDNDAEGSMSKKEERQAVETKAVEQSITGTWMSTTGGAFLTMGNNEYRLDFMGVDSDKPIIGTYSVSGDLITFVNKQDPCKDVEGKYEVRFNKQEIGFKCKSDECTKRKATLPTEWEWLDTDE